MRFVARGDEHERGVIAKFFKDAISFGVELFLHPGDREIVPHAALDLQVKAEFVRGVEGRFGRAPRMESHVVQTVILAGLENLLPGSDVRGWVTGEGKIPAEMGAAKIH